MTPADRFQLLPVLTPEEYRALKADIAEHGILLPVVVDADTGEVIDGHHRLQAFTELSAEGVKLPDYLRDVRRFSSDEERVRFVLAANLFRRHLSRAQRAEVAASLREQGWSLRRIGEAIGVDDKTIRNDLAEIAEKSAISVPARVERQGGGTYPARRPRPAPSIIVSSARDEHRARAALSTLGDDAPAKLLGLARAEERARDARMVELRTTVEVPAHIEGPDYELRLGDLRAIWDNLPEQSVDAIVTDPPYDVAGVPLFENLARLALRVLKPGRLAAIYCGHMQLDLEMELLAKGGLTYVWHGVNILPGRHSQIHSRQINGRHRSVLLFSAATFVPRRWIHDAYFAEGAGGPETRPLHPWQQAVEPIRYWVRMVSEPGETVFDPFCGSGTTAVASVSEGRRFIGGDIDPACVETTRQRFNELAEHGVSSNDSEVESHRQGE